MNPFVRRTILFAPPLALAAVLQIHPTDEKSTVFESVSPVVGDWITVHFSLLLALPLLALAVYTLLDGIRRRAATVARVALVFLSLYTAWEVMVGLGTGILTDRANELTAAERAGAASAIQALNEHWITQVAFVGGSLAWIVALVATAVAVRSLGVGWAGVALLGLASAFVIHPPPVGPIALVLFVGGAAFVERARVHAERSVPASVAVPVT